MAMSTASGKESPTFYSEMKELDNTIKVMPWAAKDHNDNPPIAITSISNAFFDLHVYVPGVASMQANLRTQLKLGDMQHPSLFLRLSTSPQHLVAKLGPWLRATKQHMWVRQLPLAEKNHMHWLAAVFCA